MPDDGFEAGGGGGLNFPLFMRVDAPEWEADERDGGGGGGVELRSAGLDVASVREESAAFGVAGLAADGGVGSSDAMTSLGSGRDHGWLHVRPFLIA